MQKIGYRIPENRHKTMMASTHEGVQARQAHRRIKQGQQMDNFKSAGGSSSVPKRPSSGPKRPSARKVMMDKEKGVEQRKSMRMLEDNHTDMMIEMNRSMKRINGVRRTTAHLMH